MMTVYNCKATESMVNFAIIHGKLLDNFTTLDCLESDFCSNTIETSRLSGVKDEIPIAVAKDRIGALKRQDEVTVIGEWRSKNYYTSDGKRHVQQYFLVREIKVESGEYRNQIALTGYLCSKPIYRTTPLKKELCELIVAVNRSYGKSDYLHCIAWNQLARKASNLKVGDKIRLSGRIQSRTYIKREHETETIKVAYEISADAFAKER